MYNFAESFVLTRAFKFLTDNHRSCQNNLDSTLLKEIYGICKPLYVGVVPMNSQIYQVI